MRFVGDLSQSSPLHSTACMLMFIARAALAIFLLWAARSIFLRTFVHACTEELFLALRKSVWIPWDAGGSPRRANMDTNEQPTNHPVYGRAYSPMPEYSDNSKYYYEKTKQPQHIDWIGHGYWQLGELRWEVSNLFACVLASSNSTEIHELLDHSLLTCNRPGSTPSSIVEMR